MLNTITENTFHAFAAPLRLPKIKNFAMHKTDVRREKLHNQFHVMPSWNAFLGLKRMRAYHRDCFAFDKVPSLPIELYNKATWRFHYFTMLRLVGKFMNVVFDKACTDVVN